MKLLNLFLLIFVLEGIGSARQPSLWSGVLLFRTAGTSCPVGTTEDTSLNGKVILGTTIADANAGTTGGNDNITPAGTNSALTFTGTPSSVIVNHVHVQNINTGTTGGSNGYGVDTSTNGSGATAISTANPTGGVASYTPTGTINTPIFTGTQFDNRSAFIRVIVCKVN